jgi:hypothetical protein
MTHSTPLYHALTYWHTQKYVLCAISTLFSDKTKAQAYCEQEMSLTLDTKSHLLKLTDQKTKVVIDYLDDEDIQLFRQTNRSRAAIHSDFKFVRLSLKEFKAIAELHEFTPLPPMSKVVAVDMSSITLNEQKPLKAAKPKLSVANL